jgi:hypothetical protein
VESYRIMSEDLDWEHVPSSAFGISFGRTSFILDTRFGVIFWLDAPDEARDTPAREKIMGDFFDDTPENEHEWRCAPAWAIADFFEVLKKQYTDLMYLPMNAREVEPWHKSYQDGHYMPVLCDVRQIYKDHSWPDLSVYNKEECMEAVAKMIHEKYPDEWY